LLLALAGRCGGAMAAGLRTQIPSNGHFEVLFVYAVVPLLISGLLLNQNNQGKTGIGFCFVKRFRHGHFTKYFNGVFELPLSPRNVQKRTKRKHLFVPVGR
jgi:hypothetical protein